MSVFLKDSYIKSFVRNVAVLFTGTAVAQLITIISIPVLSRIYGPEAYGGLGVFSSILSILGVLVVLRFDQAIIAESVNNNITRLVSSAFISTITISIGCFFIILFFKENLSVYFKISNVDTLLLLPVTVFFTGVLYIFQAIAIYSGSLKIYSKSNVFRTLVVVIAQAGLALIIANAASLVLGQLFGLMAAVIYLYLALINFLKKENISLFSLVDFKKTVAEYKEYPLYGGGQALMNSVSNNLAIFVLGFCFSPAIVGFYSLSYKLLLLPVVLLGNSVRQAFIKNAKMIINDGKKIKNLYFQATMLLSIIGVVFFGCIFHFSEPIFEMAFGSEWADAGSFGKWISVWMFFVFIKPPSTAYLYLVKKLDLLFKYEMCFFVFSIFSLYIPVFLNLDYVSVIKIFSTTAGLVNFVFVLFVYVLISKNSEATEPYGK